MSKTRKSQLPEWAARIVGLRRRLDMSQSELGRLLSSSAMGVSRWERGTQEKGD